MYMYIILFILLKRTGNIGKLKENTCIYITFQQDLFHALLLYAW